MIRKTVFSLILFTISNFIFCQVHPDLGLHGQVTWLSDSKIRVEYDWSSDAQLLDWTTTQGSKLVRGNNIVSVTGGLASVSSMVWKQSIKCSRIYAQDAKAVNSSIAHLNFVTNVLGWTGNNFNPPEIIGIIYKASGDVWLEKGGGATLPAPDLVLGVKYTIDINISDVAITAQSSADNVLYSHNLGSPEDNDRQVAVGGWGGDTEWGKLTIEGEITTPVQTPADVINIQSNGSLFAPVIEVIGNPTIEWVFNDASTSSSATPSKNYGSVGSRHNYLKVTPWSALKGINVGYDAGDDGYGGFALVPNQNVSGFQNLSLAKSSLQYLCASYSPLAEIDLRDFTALKFIELLSCNNLSTIRLGTYPVLERLCIENCNVDNLDISGCVALKEIRAAINNYTSINWGTIGASLLHICVRSNPQINVTLPAVTQFPLLIELLTWNDNQTGPFVCHSTVIQRIDAFDNHYTSADVTDCPNLKELSLSGSQLASINLGTANRLNYVRLKDCGLTQAQTDYVLHTLDGAGVTNGYLELDGNAVPSADGLIHVGNLRAKGWTIFVTLGTGTDIGGFTGKTEPIGIILNSYVLKLLLNDDFISWNANLYNMQGVLVSGKFVSSDILEFDISSLPSGIYIVVLSKSEKRRVVKVIKP